MNIVTITNISKEINFMFVSREPITWTVVRDYLESIEKDINPENTLDLEINRLGLYSNRLNKFVNYKVNFIEEV